MSAFMASFNVSSSVIWDYPEASIYVMNLDLLDMHVQTLQFNIFYKFTEIGQLKHTGYCPTLSHSCSWAKISHELLKCSVQVGILARLFACPSVIIILPVHIVICQDELETEANKGLNEGSSLQDTQPNLFFSCKMFLTKSKWMRSFERIFLMVVFQK